MNAKPIERLAYQILEASMPSKLKYLVKYMEISTKQEEEGYKIISELPYYELIRKKNEFKLEFGSLGWGIYFNSLPCEKETAEKGIELLLEEIIKKIEKVNKYYRFAEVDKYLIKYRKSKLKEKFIDLLKQWSQKSFDITSIRHYVVPKWWVKEAAKQHDKKR